MDRSTSRRPQRVRRAQPPRRELPPPAGVLVGRDGDLAAIRRLLARERLVTLLGPPGIGKTRSALQLAHEAAGEVHFVDLSHAAGVRDLHSAVAAALRVPLREGPGALSAALAARDPLLLVLDNAERLAKAIAPVLDAWLREAPAMRLLVTSVVRLGLPAEACHELPPLSVDDAVELYLERSSRLVRDEGAAREARGGERASVEELVRRLDCVPLAIELAAARARVLRPRQLLARLDGGFEVLRDAGATGRHSSVLSAIRWSWELLSPWEAEALAQASVFAGGFTLDAAEGILALGDGPPVLDVLEALRDKSFLQLGAEEPPRFRMLESIRSEAHARLVRAGGEAAARRRHAAFYSALGELEVDGAPDTARLARLVAERENQVAAHRHSSPADAARAALALVPVLAMQGPPDTELEVLDAGVAAARACDAPLVHARLLRARALAWIRRGFLAEARGDLERCLERARALGERKLELHARIETGRLHVAAGEFDEATRLLRDCVLEARRVGVPFLEGYARNLLGMAEEAMGRLEEATVEFEAALRTFRRCRNRRFEGIARMNLGVAQASLGRTADAAALFERAVRAFRRVEDRAGEADAVLNLGSVNLTAGRIDEAEPLLRAGLELERKLGNRRSEAFALGSLALAAQDRGELHTARELLDACVDVCRLAGERRFAGVFLPFRGAALAALGREEEARVDFAAARAYLEELGDRGALATLELLEGFAERDPASLAPRLAAARSRLAEGARTAELVVAIRLAERRLHAAAGAAPERGGAEPGPGLTVGPDARWFRVGGGEPVDLRRRRAHRLILRALVDRRLSAPGVGLPVEALFEEGWPGDRALPSAAAARVYVAVRALRAMGLADLLRRQDDGYLLEPSAPLRRASGAGP